MKTFFWTFVPHDQEWIWYLIRPFILWKKGIIVCWIKKMTRCQNATNYFISMYSFKTKESTISHLAIMMPSWHGWQHVWWQMFNAYKCREKVPQATHILNVKQGKASHIFNFSFMVNTNS
jgi:hypothetical protein